MKFSKLETIVILFLVVILVASIILAPKGSYIDSGKRNELPENVQVPEEVLPPNVESENINVEKEPDIDNAANEIEAVPDGEPKSEDDDWGVYLHVGNVTSQGLTYYFEQKGGTPTGDLQYGSDYIIEKLVEDKWVKVEYIISEENIAWTAIAYMIPKEASTAEKQLNWTFFYGELSAGTYRLGKSVMDFRQTGDFDEKMYYAEFTL